MSLVRSLTIALLFTFLALPVRAADYCFEQAGRTHGIEPGLLWAIAKVESNFDPEAVGRNPDGSFDVGLMQINSRWREQLGRQTWDRLFDPCTNVEVAAVILSDCLDRHGYSWEGIGCYNAVSIDKRAIYARKVLGVMEQLLEEQKTR